MESLRVLCNVSLFLVVLMCQNGSNCADTVPKDREILVFTVASHENDGFRRFMQSAKELYGFDVQVLGMGKEWQGGDIANTAGGGYKVNLLRTAMQPYAHRKDLIIMFVDSYDLIFAAGPDDILAKFDKLGARVLFSAEGFCWPDASLADSYPEVSHNEKRFLNSGGFMGYATDIAGIVATAPISNLDDDQYYYTQILLDNNLRNKYQMKLDTRGEIFQNLNGALEEVQIKYRGAESYLYNMRSGSTPAIIHGNGPIKPEFNTLSNYLNGGWTPTHGCQACKLNTISLSDVKHEDFPLVLLAIFVEHPTPFLAEFFTRVAKLQYPKSRISLFIHYADKLHEREVKGFLAQYGSAYTATTLLGPSHDINEYDARNTALTQCTRINCQYYMSMDGEAQIINPGLITHLVQSNRSVIGPMVARPGKMWSNFWGALGKDGYYKRAEDYTDILHNNQRGQWNVPFLSTVYLVQAYLIPGILADVGDGGGYKDGDNDPDMSFCKKLRQLGAFMFVDNTVDWGRLTNPDNYESTHLHNDMYAMYDNKIDWEEKYIHPEYQHSLEEHVKQQEPCADVYWFPLMSHTFTVHLVEEVEHFGQWSGGKESHADERVAGGYENVPTVDIHMNQIGWESQWLTIIKDYIGPMVTKNFMGYYTDARAHMNFVVKYKMGEQELLRPHHDASTYTINVALNDFGLDYQGGGVNFLRYNCTITNTKRGYGLLHPGRLTHYHQGLQLQSGTRYIMISFIDP